MSTELPTPDRPETEIDPAAKAEFARWIKEKTFVPISSSQNVQKHESVDLFEAISPVLRARSRGI